MRYSRSSLVYKCTSPCAYIVSNVRFLLLGRVDMMIFMILEDGEEGLSKFWSVYKLNQDCS